MFLKHTDCSWLDLKHAMKHLKYVFNKNLKTFHLLII